MVHFFKTLCWVAIIAISANNSFAFASGKPSFDCAKASAPDEVAICSNTELSNLDRLISSGYGFLLQRLGKKTANKIHLPFFRTRQECGSDEFCIRDVLLGEIPSFTSLGFKFDPPPSDTAFRSPSYEQLKRMIHVGECTSTVIKETSYRLCGPDDNGVCIPQSDSGSSVILENGTYGVSYETVGAISHSQSGDPVVACLIEVPQDCPPGDDRGYIWGVDNLRTHEHWDLPDAEHGCGGA